jgi:hypothetical protein
VPSDCEDINCSFRDSQWFWPFFVDAKTEKNTSFSGEVILSTMKM